MVGSWKMFVLILNQPEALSRELLSAGFFIADKLPRYFEPNR
jgi:hypothetical protein